MWAVLVLRVRHGDGVREEERYMRLCPLVRHRRMVKRTSAWGMSSNPGAHGVYVN